jgi:hypothetical protein
MIDDNKKKNDFGRLLQSRVFTLKDQVDFSEFSGDKNPIHINPLEARRTIAGQCIVHGINSLLWALDVLVFSTGLTVRSCKAKFQNSIYLEESIDCFWNEKSNKISLVSKSTVLCNIKIEPGPVKKNDSIEIPICKSRNVPEAQSFEECLLHHKISLSFFGNPEMSKQLFPSFVAEYGNSTACDLALLSEIVGMQVPGLNSIFLSVQVDFLENQESKFFKIVKSDSRYETMELAINASTISALAQVVFRPSSKGSQSIIEIGKKVTKGEFKNLNALIVGGSRGLGEIVAKLIACGGGKSVITYNSGVEEATRLKNEITTYGETCDIVQLSVGNNNNVLDHFKGFNQLYYFATPKIFGKRSFGFDETLLSTFIEVYIKEFERVCDTLLKRTDHLDVFYPSSIAIEKPLASLAEYIASKIKGEEFCEELNKKNNITVFYPRLPRIDTDQTLSLIKAASADAVEVLLPYLREMTISTNSHKS